MNEPDYDYGTVLAAEAEAIGEPGKRRFRLLVRSGRGGGDACVWMEKEQLAGIGSWFADVLRRLERERPKPETDLVVTRFGAIFEVEFRVGQLALGYIDDEDLLVIQAFDIETQQQGGRPKFRCNLSRSQARALSRRIEEVVAGGRPICPLCEQPIGPEGHVCPRANGHKAEG